MKEVSHNYELIDQISWGHSALTDSFFGEFTAASFEDEGFLQVPLFLSIPLHEDFYDFARAYCDQYKIHIEEKLK